MCPWCSPPVPPRVYRTRPGGACVWCNIVKNFIGSIVSFYLQTELDRPPYSLVGILVLIAVSRARPLANAYSAVHLPPLHHASLRHRLASIVSLTPLASPVSLASLISPPSPTSCM